MWHRLNATGRFRPSGSWRGQRSGVGPRFRDAGPGSKTKTSAHCGAFTRTGRPRPATDTVHCPYSLATHHSPLTTRHLPSAIPDSEFGDPELGPFCMHDTLRNATVEHNARTRRHKRGEKRKPNATLRTAAVRPGQPATTLLASPDQPMGESLAAFAIRSVRRLR